jgi:hypothetical protein
VVQIPFTKDHQPQATMIDTKYLTNHVRTHHNKLTGVNKCPS